MKYEVTRMFADGVERKRTLAEVAHEIEANEPNVAVEVNSRKSGRVWCGRAKNLLADLTHSFCKHCVQEIEVDEYGITLIMR